MSMVRVILVGSIFAMSTLGLQGFLPAVDPVVALSEVDVTDQYAQEIEMLRVVAAQTDGAFPDAQVGPIVVVAQLDPGCPSFSGCAYPDGRIEIQAGMQEGKTLTTVIHEIAHTLTRPQDAGSRTFEEAHDPVFCSVFEGGFLAVHGVERSSSSMCDHEVPSGE